DDVWVLQMSSRFGFGAEAGKLVRTSSFAGTDHLQCHYAIEPWLASLVDDAHPALAEQSKQFVTGHGRTDGFRGRGQTNGSRGIFWFPEYSVFQSVELFVTLQ